jgi:thioesterase domain-containing protein
LLAVKLAAKLNEAGFDIPLQRIFQSPTVAAMAASLDETVHTSPVGRPIDEIDTIIVPIQTRGNKPALFVVAPAGGVVYPYFHLARLLNDTQPIIGLQDPAQAGAPATPRSVQAYAALYLEAMRRVQPHGPYHLLGWSFAGCVAYEIALQLEREGEPPGLLCLVDTRVRDRRSRGVLSTIRHFTNQAVVVVGVTVSIYSLLLNGFYLLAARARRRAVDPGAGWAEKIKQQWASLWMRAMLRKSEFAHLIPEDSQLAMAAVPTFAVTVNILRLNSAAGIRYKPERSTISATLIRAGGHVFGESHDTTESYGWDELVGELRVHTVPGNHAQMFTSPSVEALAGVLQAELDRVNATG